MSLSIEPGGFVPSPAGISSMGLKKRPNMRSTVPQPSGPTVIPPATTKKPVAVEGHRRGRPKKIVAAGIGVKASVLAEAVSDAVLEGNIEAAILGDTDKPIAEPVVVPLLSIIPPAVILEPPVQANKTPASRESLKNWRMFG